MNGFTYNGIHCSVYNVDYVPGASDRWFADPEYDTYTKKISWRAGGYYFGNSVNIREIKLDCYFEEISIATREKIRKWLGRNTTGRLIFDERPFVYYNVRPGEIVSGKIYNDLNDTYSGTFSVTFLAVDPFGYLTRKSNSGTETDGASNYCGIISANMMPDSPTTSSTVFDVYNPGTENCGLSIKMSGSCNKPIRFFNNRNKTECVINALPSSGLILDLNGDTGLVIDYASNAPDNFSNGFAYHDYGMVRLEPDVTYTGIAYTATENGTAYMVTPTGLAVTEELVGGMIHFNTPATRTATIASVNTSTGVLTCMLGGSGTLSETGTMNVSTENRINIQEKNDSGNWIAPSTLIMDSIEIDYKPRLL